MEGSILGPALPADTEELCLREVFLEKVRPGRVLDQRALLRFTQVRGQTAHDSLSR